MEPDFLGRKKSACCNNHLDQSAVQLGNVDHTTAAEAAFQRPWCFEKAKVLAPFCAHANFIGETISQPEGPSKPALVLPRHRIC